MSGHSKWKNIQHRKNAQDAKRSQQFQKFAKEIFVAAKKETNPDINPALRLAIDKARAVNMPKDNITRAIEKANGAKDGNNWEEVTYEGYGPNGVAILVKTLTDNKLRTMPQVRNAFNKSGANMAEPGSVSYLFKRKAKFIFESKENEDADELMLNILELGAEDVEYEENVFDVIAPPENFDAIKDYLLNNEYGILEMDVRPISDSLIELTEEQETKVQKIIDLLEEIDDVQDIYHNADM